MRSRHKLVWPEPWTGGYAIRKSHRRRNQLRQFAAHGLEVLEARLLLDGSANGPSLPEFVLYADGSLQLGRSVDVADGWSGAGGDLRAGRDAKTSGLAAGDTLVVQQGAQVAGDLIGNDEVSVGARVIVSGDVDARGEVVVRSGVRVTGTVNSSAEIIRKENTVLGGIQEFGTPRVFQPPRLPDPSDFAPDPNKDLDIGLGRTLTIPPGAYGSLHLQKQSTLRLATGSYYFEEISAERGVEIEFNLESGPVAVFVAGALHFGRGLDVELHGGDARDVFVETHGNFHLHSKGQWQGTVFAPEGEIRLGRRTTLVGAAYAGENIAVRTRSVLRHAPADRLSAPPNPTPVEPPRVLSIESDTGSSPEDGWTSDRTPRVFGSGLPGHEIAVFQDGFRQGTVSTSASDGSWSFDLPSLGDGSYAVTATQTRSDPAGPVSSVPSVALSITIDTAAPPVTVSLSATSDSGIVGDRMTTRALADIEGETTADALVQVFDGRTGNVLGTTAPDSDGDFRFDSVFLGLGDGSFTVTSTDPAGNTATADLAILRLPCEPVTHLAEFTVAAVDAPAAGVAIERYTRGSADSVGDLQPLVPAGSDRISVALAALDQDVRADLVSVSPVSDVILVFLDTPDGILGQPARYGSGGMRPAAVAVGNFVGGPAADIAVGHEDGTVSFLEGVGDGSFRARPDLTVRGLGAVGSLTHADFDRDGDDDLVVVGSELTLFKNADDMLTAPPIRNGSFAEALTGWTTEALGVHGGASGRVNAPGGIAQLTENESFLVSLNQTLTIPPAPRTLSFDLVSLVLEDLQGGAPDAFEVSLLDSNSNSLVPAFRAEATSFFNITPSGAPSLASGVTFDGTRVTLDISAITPGTAATLFFDLIGNGPGTGSSAVIDNVRVAPEAIYVDAPTQVRLLPAIAAGSAASHCDAHADGDLDLLVNEPAVPRFSMLENDGAGGLTPVESGFTESTGAIAAAIGSRGLGSTYVKFYVADGGATFAYGPDGSAQGSFSIDTARDLRGMTSARAQDGVRLWAIDAATDRVLVHDPERGHVGDWTALGIDDPEGIATDGADIWIVDASSDRVLRYSGAASAVAGSRAPTDGFSLTAGNNSPADITTDGNVFWVVDDTGDAVFIYDSAGTPLGQWSLDPRNQDASGIALGGRDLWVVDRADLALYRYLDAAGVLSGAVQATNTYALDGLNTAPEGIADPPIEIGQVVNDSIESVGDTDEFTFEYFGFQTLLFDAQSGDSTTFDWTLADPFGGTVFSDSFRDLGPVFGEIGGTYTLTVQGHAGGTGAYEFQIHEVQFIAIGDLVVDQLAPPGDQRNWVFDVPADQPLFIDFQALSSGPLFIELWAPDNSLLLSDSGTTASELDNGLLTLADAGLYRLNVTGDGSNTPDYQFQLLDHEPMPPDVRMMNIGEVASGAIESPGAVDIWEFTAAAGQDVFIDFQSLTLTSGAISFVLRAPDGTVLAAGGGVSTDGLDTGPITLPATGVYWLTVEGVGDTPTYEFQLWAVPPPDVAALTLGNATNGEIETPGTTDIWTFSAVAGQMVFIDFQSLTDGALIQLDSPDGTTILLDSAADNGPITLPDTGVYRFAVRGSGDRTPAYQFTLWDVRPDVPTPISVGTLALPAPVADTRRPGESLTYTFAAEAGDELAFHLSLNTDDANVFMLVSPSGTELLAGVTSNQLLDPLTESGTYNLHVTRPPIVPLDTHGSFMFEIVELVAPPLGTPDNRGTEFWLTIPQNFREPFLPQTVEVSVVLTAISDTSAIITIPATDYIRFVEIAAGELVPIVLPPEAEISGQVEGIADTGVRIISSDEITVFAHSNQTFSSDGFLALPRDILGTEYLVLGYETTVALAGTQLALLATEDDTTVTITPADTIGSHEAGVPYELQLNRGQAYQLAGVLAAGADVTGTVITSDTPIAVYGGNRCTVVPVGNFDACDFVVEQLPPVDAWGEQFVTLPLATRLGGDTFRMLAQQDGTEVSVNGNVAATLNRGEFHEQLIDGPAEIAANLPILVAQFANSQSFDGVPADPFMMLVPPAEQFAADYTLPALDDPQFDRHFVNIIVPGDAVGAVTLDGVAVPAGVYAAIGSTGFFGAQIGVSVGTHRLTGSRPFGASVYGFGSTDSYAFAGGVNLTPPVMVASVELEPETISRAVGSQHTVTATVADQFDQPMSGVLVNFAVTGVNETTGSVPTDALGEASFTFTGVQPGIDSIVAFVGTLFDTASVR